MSNGEQLGLILDIAEGSSVVARLDELKGQMLTITANSSGYVYTTS